MSAALTGHEPELVQPEANWQGALSEAAVQLMAGPGDILARLRAAGALLAAIAPDGASAVAAAESLQLALATIDEALAGSAPAESAAERVGELLESLMTQRSAAPASPLGTAASELLPEFLAESADNLAQAEAAFLELEADPSSAESLNAAFRAFHSLKSSAAFLGLEALSTLSHDAESLLATLRDGRTSFDQSCADLLLAAADAMRELLRHVEMTGTPTAPTSLPAGYGALRDRLRQAARADATEPARVMAPAQQLPLDAGSPPAPHRAGSDAWARVRTERLDQLVDLVGELTVAQAMVAQNPAILQDRHGALARDVQQASKLLRQLHDLSVALRMVPVRPLFQRAHRLVRDLAARSGKQIEVIIEGEETEIDRTMVDALWDPLVHLLRNGVDHAIEPAAERSRCGKAAVGSLRLSARQVRGAVLVEVQDDGRGLDRERILHRARERGLIATDAQLSVGEIDELIFAAGLSTAADVSELSGRGVGMDVVRGNVEGLGGRVEVASVAGEGTTFTLRLPLTLALTDGMIVRAGTERYIAPTFSIATTLRPAAVQLVTEAGGGEAVLLHGEALPLVRLHHVFSIPDAVTDPTSALVLALAGRQARFALLVDGLEGQQQFLARPLASGLGSVGGIAGSAVLADGRVGLILDAASLLTCSRQLPPWGRAGVQKG